MLPMPSSTRKIRADSFLNPCSSANRQTVEREVGNHNTSCINFDMALSPRQIEAGYGWSSREADRTLNNERGFSARPRAQKSLAVTIYQTRIRDGIHNILPQRILSSYDAKDIFSQCKGGPLKPDNTTVDGILRHS